MYLFLFFFLPLIVGCFKYLSIKNNVVRMNVIKTVIGYTVLLFIVGISAIKIQNYYLSFLFLTIPPIFIIFMIITWVAIIIKEKNSKSNII